MDPDNEGVIFKSIFLIVSCLNVLYTGGKGFIVRMLNVFQVFFHIKIDVFFCT